MYFNSAVSTCIPTVSNLKPPLQWPTSCILTVPCQRVSLQCLICTISSVSYFKYLNSDVSMCIPTVSYLKPSLQCPSSCILTVPSQRVSLQCLICTISTVSYFKYLNSDMAICIPTVSYLNPTLSFFMYLNVYSYRVLFQASLQCPLSFFPKYSLVAYLYAQSYIVHLYSVTFCSSPR